jgi:hypothetical protein
MATLNVRSRWMRWRESADRKGFLNDPNAVEIKGESFTYPADITEDRDGKDLRAAVALGRTITREELAGFLGLDAEAESRRPDGRPTT